MKLKDLEVFVVGTPAPHWGGRYWIFVKLTTDSGVSGIGEVYAASVGPKAMTAVIEDVFERHMADENPENVELMFRRCYASGFTGRPDLTVMGAFSGMEIACWDILGKSLGRPIYALLGGCANPRVRAYTYIYPQSHDDHDSFWADPDAQADAAAKLVTGHGFSAVKFDPAGPYTMRGGHMPSLMDLELSVEMCRAIRKAVGTRADLLFGTHGQFSTGGAMRLAQAIAEFDPLWYEEPIPPDQIDEMAKLARSVSIPIATGERLTTKAEFGAILRAGAANILQPALGRSGGILETKKIAGMAESFNAQIAPHLYAGPVEWAANIQLAITQTNTLMVETIGTGGEFHKALVPNMPKFEDGYILAPTGPGLGIEFDEEVARGSPYLGNKLHLEMQEAPISYHQPNAFAGGASDHDG